MDPSHNPLLSALPPQTDYISYLTIVEQYLSKDNLPVLADVLQDETLTINIGWDLVQILLPYLPASRECLHTIARLGNPREVILKVTEALRLIDYDAENEDEAEAAAKSETASLQIEQFDVLLSMLVTLHARIKTKYPSRFLSTTLQAILASFSSSKADREDMVVSIVQTVKQIRGVKRPTLPSRSSSGTIHRVMSAGSGLQAQDPEASTTEVLPEETALQTKLFQSFVTHVVEEYLTSLPEHSGLQHMAWATRLVEHTQPQRLLHMQHGDTLTAKFSKDQALRNRVDTVGQLASLSQDLGIADDDLLAAITTSQVGEQTTEGEEEPPPTAADVPLSSPGSLLLYATRHISAALYGHADKSIALFHIFPQHNRIIRALSTSGAGPQLGGEPLAAIDACLALGLLALSQDQIGEPADDEQFDDYLRIAALLSSTCPDSSLRGHCHYLVSTVLRSHPDRMARLAFIRDVLENTPMDNLKSVAVTWLKGELMDEVMADADRSTIAAELESFAPLVFPQVSGVLADSDFASFWTAWQANVWFYLASLNLIYLMLLVDNQRGDVLKSKDLLTRHKVRERFVDPLHQANARVRKAIEDGKTSLFKELDDVEKVSIRAELTIFDQTFERIEEVTNK